MLWENAREMSNVLFKDFVSLLTLLVSPAQSTEAAKMHSAVFLKR